LWHFSPHYINLGPHNTHVKKKFIRNNLMQHVTIQNN
jgi:hypothetical protein